MICALLFLLAFPALAKEAFLRDVPEGHWAYDAVYDLIRRGVTSGYPDGTYRGNKLMSRFEIASFLSKLTKSFEVKKGIDEKLIQELKAELALLQEENGRQEREKVVAGEIVSRLRSGGQADYRLKGSLLRNFSQSASLRIGLDTMDSGYGGSSRDLIREMLEVEGKVKMGSASFKVTSGPGDVEHSDSGSFPLEDKQFYRHQRRTLSYSSQMGATAFSLEYLARSRQTSGLVEVSEISATLTQKISRLRLSLNPRLFYNTAGERDIRFEIKAELDPLTLLVGMAKNSQYPHGLYGRGEVAVTDEFRLVVQKVGSEYREKFTYNIFDIFDRNLPDGSASLGLQFSRKMGSWFISIKADRTDPGGVISSESRLGININNKAKMGLVYQAYQAARSLGLETTFAW